MKEITIDSDHKLPYGYWYEKPIVEEVRHLKSDQEIIEELKGTMPLGEIARICDKPVETALESELKAKIDVQWANDNVWIIVYPCTVDGEPIQYEWELSDEMYDWQREQFIEEKLNQIIYD